MSQDGDRPPRRQSSKPARKKNQVSRDARERFRGGRRTCALLLPVDAEARLVLRADDDAVLYVIAKNACLPAWRESAREPCSGATGGGRTVGVDREPVLAGLDPRYRRDADTRQVRPVLRDVVHRVLRAREVAKGVRWFLSTSERRRGRTWKSKPTCERTALPPLDAEAGMVTLRASEPRSADEEKPGIRPAISS